MWQHVATSQGLRDVRVVADVVDVVSGVVPGTERPALRELSTGPQDWKREFC